MRWSIDGFIRELFRRFWASERKIPMIYTADHGQRLLDAFEDSGSPRLGRPVSWPHGPRGDPPARQAAVPVILFGFGDGIKERRRRRYEPALRDRASRFEIFPSLSYLEGDEAAETRAHHRSLFDPATDREHQTFVPESSFGIGGVFGNHEFVGSSCSSNEFDAR